MPSFCLCSVLLQYLGRKEEECEETFEQREELARTQTKLTFFAKLSWERPRRIHGYKTTSPFPAQILVSFPDQIPAAGHQTFWSLMFRKIKFCTHTNKKYGRITWKVSWLWKSSDFSGCQKWCQVAAFGVWGKKVVALVESSSSCGFDSSSTQRDVVGRKKSVTTAIAADMWLLQSMMCQIRNPFDDISHTPYYKKKEWRIFKYFKHSNRGWGLKT